MEAPVFNPDLPYEVAPEASQVQGPVSDIASAAVNPPESLSSAKPAFDPNKPFETSEEHYGTGEQQFKAGLEGLGQGLLGPLATMAETKLMGVKPEDIIARKEENPWTHGIAEGVGLLSPVGEGALLAKAAGKIVPALGIGSTIGSMAAKGAIEAGLFQGGDEISKAMLGQGDPQAPVASALAHMGAASLFGSALGGAFGVGSAGLKKIGETQIGSKMSQMAEDFGSRWKFNQENPSLYDAVKHELDAYHGATSAAADEVYGSNGLKQQAIDRLVPELNENISKQTQTISDKLTSKMSEMIKDSDSFPPRLAKKFQEMGNKWMEVVTNPEASSKQVFGATQELKQELQSYAKFDKRVGPFDPSSDFIKTAKELSHDIRTSLEDHTVWGDAAHLQKGINKAFTEFLPAQKDFLSKFATKVEGEHVIDPGKVNTYINQLGKPNAEIKQQVMENYLRASEKYRNEIEKLHHSIGVDSPIPPASLTALEGTLSGKQSPGSKLADYIFNKAPSTVGSGIATGVGTATGAAIGGGAGATAGLLLSSKLAPYFEEVLGRPVSKYGAEAIFKALSSGSAKSIGQALDHAANVRSGAQKINRGLDSIFRVGSQQMVDANVTDKERDKVKKYIQNGGLDQQIQEMDKPHPLQNLQPKKFAKGGEVQNTIQPIKTPIKEPSQLPNVYPEQSMMMNTAKGRISQYLTALQPTPPTQLPFDRPLKDMNKERAYNNAIDLAIQPLGILNNIKDNTITPEHIQHIAQMYPELKSHLDKQIMERVSDKQMDKELVPYSTRVSLSLFLGAPLDSTMTPAAIMAAQPIPKAPPQQGKAASGSPSKLGKANNLTKTPGQEAEQDRSSRD